MWLYRLSRATLAFAILIFHLSQHLISGFVPASCLSNFYFGCPSEPAKGIRVLGKCPDNLQVGQTLLCFLSCQGEAAGNSSPLPNEEAEGLSSFKIHVTGHFPPKWGCGQLCLDTQLPNAAD